MTRIIVDEALRSRLKNFAEPLELCDACGRVLARLTAMTDLVDYEPCEPEITEEELRTREQAQEWHTTAELLAQLTNLEHS